MTHKTNILSTRPLPSSLIEEAEKDDIHIEAVSFIHTEPVAGDALAQQLAELYTREIVAVFTSMNAVEAVTNFASADPHWKIFCIGDTTAALVRQHFGDVVAGTAQNASELADVIIEAGIGQVVFFCGDQRRPELPEKLTAHNVTVDEVMVYKTIQTPERVQNNYDGILFFSPSAVESFFAANIIRNNTVLFAIGQTTANAIQKFANNLIVTSERPGKEALAQQAIAYFKSIRALR